MNGDRIKKILRITARVFATLSLLFWGSFFIEHLSWFFKSTGAPPLEVYVISIFHLTLLIGYVIFWKWELVGSILILVSSTIFFSQTAGNNFIMFWIISIVPALIFIFMFLYSKKKDKNDNR
jgi:hypothetical protein